ncbi:MAG: TIGR01440 family protein [Fusicatenibacter sp.]|nr:TIGR01440 family protein [Lachnospiraceae bacterium]MDY2938883.1 TIGR01440 family protein [Fusicatenibacter sp.]
MLDEIKKEAREIAEELIETANMKPGQILVVGCSSSEIAHYRLGTHSSTEIGKAVFEAIYETANAHQVYLAAQCCEHLNRAVILEREAAGLYRYEEVSVVPHLKGGGSFATATYYGLKDPVAVEHVKAHAGIDIGDVLIGMQLKDVAVPVRTKRNAIGDAHVVCARTRPKYIGGERAHYTEDPTFSF